MNDPANAAPANTIARRRGRPTLQEGPALDRGLLVERLIALAQTKGVEALNMRQVAAGLGVSSRLLYHYVRDKEEMLQLLSDAILARNPPDLSSPSWQTRLHVIARTNYDNFRKFPGLPSAILARTLRKTTFPQAIAIRQAIFKALEDAGLQRPEAEEAFVLYTLVTMGSLTMLEHWAEGEPGDISHSVIERSVVMGVELVIFGIERQASLNRTEQDPDGGQG